MTQEAITGRSFLASTGTNHASSNNVFLDNQPTPEGEPNGQDRRRRDEDGERKRSQVH
jgi:hypothetical protein